MLTPKPPIKVSDASGLAEQLQPTDLVVGLRMDAVAPASKNIKWTAQTVADFVKQQVVAGTIVPATPQWVPGSYPAGALVYHLGLVYRSKGITDSQAAPGTFSTSGQFWEPVSSPPTTFNGDEFQLLNQTVALSDAVRARLGGVDYSQRIPFDGRGPTQIPATSIGKVAVVVNTGFAAGFRVTLPPVSVADNNRQIAVLAQTGNQYIDILDRFIEDGHTAVFTVAAGQWEYSAYSTAGYLPGERFGFGPEFRSVTNTKPDTWNAVQGPGPITLDEFAGDKDGSVYGFRNVSGAPVRAVDRAGNDLFTLAPAAVAVYRRNSATDYQYLYGNAAGPAEAIPTSVPFGPLTATGQANETFPCPGMTTVRAVLVLDAIAAASVPGDPDDDDPAPLFETMYTVLNPGTDQAALSITRASRVLGAGDQITFEGYALVQEGSTPAQDSISVTSIEPA